MKYSMTVFFWSRPAQGQVRAMTATRLPGKLMKVATCTQKSRWAKGLWRAVWREWDRPTSHNVLREAGDASKTTFSPAQESSKSEESSAATAAIDPGGGDGESSSISCASLNPALPQRLARTDCDLADFRAEVEEGISVPSRRKPLVRRALEAPPPSVLRRRPHHRRQRVLFSHGVTEGERARVDRTGGAVVDWEEV